MVQLRPAIPGISVTFVWTPFRIKYGMAKVKDAMAMVILKPEARDVVTWEENGLLILRYLEKKLKTLKVNN